MMPRCRSCGAPVEWVQTLRGKWMPVNPGYQLVVTDGGWVVRGRVPHWATCPHADGWRMKEPAGAGQDTRHGRLRRASG